MSQVALEHSFGITYQQLQKYEHGGNRIDAGRLYHIGSILNVEIGYFFFIEAVPCRIRTVLTDDGVQFTSRPRDIYDSQHIFDRVCDGHGIEHRLTQVNHPWTNGQSLPPRRRGDATVKRYHDDSHDQLRTHLHLFVDAYNHARRLKTLRGLTPPEVILNAWTKEPDRFRIEPSHLSPRPYT